MVLDIKYSNKFNVFMLILADSNDIFMFKIKDILLNKVIKHN
ncbi:hypothetical protein ANASTE_01968 [Anaerofustis stercorihominis DSM 17244]|uniref:Uncharacterized protein n=1 Tax=Anaerofustis stercorihominis DSM 17244 TaxID=445971 RepID=B1C993_9FIRM|nr:hypothetical protein ANASTE_01968 [Anaerofustis stercorihominis DSM 17244]